MFSSTHCIQNAVSGCNEIIQIIDGALFLCGKKAGCPAGDTPTRACDIGAVSQWRELFHSWKQSAVSTLCQQSLMLFLLH